MGIASQLKIGLVETTSGTTTCIVTTYPTLLGVIVTAATSVDRPAVIILSASVEAIVPNVIVACLQLVMTLLRLLSLPLLRAVLHFPTTDRPEEAYLALLLLRRPCRIVYRRLTSCGTTISAFVSNRA